MPKARLTIVVEFELDKNNYAWDGDRQRTSEEIEALTGEQMLECEKQYLADGDTSIEEIVGNAEADIDQENDVKWELVEDKDA